MAINAEPRQRTLSEFHKRSLMEGSGLSEETILAAGVWSATRDEAKTILGFDPRSGGIVFPYPGCGNYVRIRLDAPYAGPGYSKAAKYLTPPKAGNHLYVPPKYSSQLHQSRILVITEGEKKALKACQEGIPCIGTAGVWSWKGRNEYGERQSDHDGILEDFDRFNLSQKELIVLVYDSDIDQLHPAWEAYGRLAEQLYARGARQIKIVTLPSLVEDGKTGLDDYLLRRKTKDFYDLIERTPIWLPSGDGAKPFAERRLQAAVERMTQERSVDPAYSTETLEALTSLYLHAETEYVRAKQMLADAAKPGKISKRAINQQVKAMADAVRKRQNCDPSRMAVPQAPVELPELPVKLRQPRGWRVTERGVLYETNDGIVVACPVPVVLTRRLRHVTSGDERIELAYRRDGDWHSVTANRSTVFNRTSIVQLADKGLPVSSESSKHLVRYLAELEAENLDVLPLVKASDKMGWVGKMFLPGAAEDVVLDVEDGSAALADAYHEAGSFDEWKKAMEPVRKSTIGRFVLAAGFAAPLLRLLRHRVFIVHVWGPSRGGKSAVVKAALSIWGEPETLLASFNATKVGMERLAAFYSDLPLGVDERQVVGDKQGFIEGLVYLLGLGKGKTRGAKSGGLQHFNRWQTIVLSTGEEPLSAETSQTGIRTRTLELRGVPLEDEGVARKLHMMLSEHYGHAGPRFIRQVIRDQEEMPEGFREDWQALVDELQAKVSDKLGSHVTAVAAIAVADFYASQWIFDVYEDQAHEEAIQLASEVLEMLETAAEADVATRAWEFTQNWLAAYAEQFSNDCRPPRYGFREVGRIYVVSSILEKALREEGFSPRAVLPEFAERGWIDTYTDSAGKRRFKVLRRMDGKRAWFVAINEEGYE